MRLNPSEDFFFRDHQRFRDETSPSENLKRQFFSPIRKVLENHDLGKNSLPPKNFWASMPMVITTVCFKCTAGPSIISKDRIWAIVKKGCRPLLYIMLGNNVLGRFYRNTSNNNSIVTTQRCNIEFTVSM